MIDTKALREKVLDLAIRGKLVPQDPNDEPASVLLERIRMQKEEMVKEGKLKAKDIKNDTIIFKSEDNLHYEKFQDGTVKCIEDEIPFEVPEGWEWERLGNVTSIARGGSPRPIKSYLTTATDGVNWIKIGDTEKDGKYIFSTKEKIKPEGMAKSRYVKSGDFLLTNSMSFGRPYILKTDGCIHDGWLVIGNIESVFNQDYLYYALSANFMYKTLAVLAGGSTVDNLNSDLVKTLLFPIPPINEQISIAKKVDALLMLVETIHSNEEIIINDIEQVKSKILDLAIRGKLVSQDLNDEPASMLLERIRTEKEELIKQGKIKRDKKESLIFKGDDNSYYEKVDGISKKIDAKTLFDIPENWHWERLGNISTIARGGSPRPIDDYLTTDKNGINWIKIGDAEQGEKYIYRTKEKIKPDGLSKTRYVKSGDFLLTNSMSFGRPYILKTDGCIHDGWLVVGNIKSVFNQDFLYYALSSDFMYNSFAKLAAGSTVKNLKSDTVRSVLFPVPPRQEQKRISQHLENLFYVLAKIEQSLS